MPCRDYTDASSSPLPPVAAAAGAG
uniref:Uncharacterized protein n=1 Tax=Arundo donax TaxID=35708 RepID=A0A0A9FQC0_ARUDO